MKKLLAILTLMTYFTVSTGFIVSLHYCMDELDSAQLGASSEKKCGKCGMEKDGGCCRDEVTMVKLETTHMAASAVQASFQAPAPQAIQTAFLSIPFRNYSPSLHAIAHSPPLVSEQDTYLDICVFRI
jgi:hypothetical protein